MVRLLERLSVEMEVHARLVECAFPLRHHDGRHAVADQIGRIGSLLLGYYAPEGKLIYAGRVGTGMPVAELERLWQRLQPWWSPRLPLDESPPRGTRFGSPLVLSRVHWVRPEMAAEVSYVEWTPDDLLRHVVYLGEHQDKLATEVRRSKAIP
jgi:ATP-dependent DNA ligase